MFPVGSSNELSKSRSSHNSSSNSYQGEGEERVARQFNSPGVNGRNELSNSRSSHNSSSNSYQGEGEEREARLEVGSGASDSMPNRIVTPVLVLQRVELPCNVMKVDNNEEAKLQAFLICLAGNEVTSSNVGKNTAVSIFCAYQSYTRRKVNSFCLGPVASPLSPSTSVKSLDKCPLHSRQTFLLSTAG